MDTYPLLRGLLAELCGLDGEDLELPIAVLANLHRAQLRAPLMVIPYLDRAHDELARGLNRAVDVLDARYPELAYGNIYREVPALGALTRVAVVDDLNFYLQHMLGDKPEESTVLLYLIMDEVDSGYGGKIAWHSFSAPWLLYELTLPHGGVAIAADRLEIVLGLHPSVRRSLLQLAVLSREEAEAMTFQRARHLADAERLQAQLVRFFAPLSPRGILQRLRGRN